MTELILWYTNLIGTSQNILNWLITPMQIMSWYVAPIYLLSGTTLIALLSYRIIRNLIG